MSYCSGCGLWKYGPWCLKCPPPQPGPFDSKCPCGDCQRKAGEENFEDPHAFERRERARRFLEMGASQKCVECGVLMAPGAHRYSLACPKCVEKLGTDEATGRWSGVPEPSEREKKEVA